MKKADRNTALAEWTREVEGNGIAVTSLMRSAYRDGWDDAIAASSATPSAQQDKRGSSNEHQAAVRIAIDLAKSMGNMPLAAGLGDVLDLIVRAASTSANGAQGAAIAIRPDQIAEIANKYALGNPRLDALLGFINEVIIVNGAEYAKSE